VSKYWKIFCEETKYPGLWQRWFKNQCVAAGFIPEEGYALEGKSIKAGWSKARNALKRMEQGDMVVVQLGGNRVARIGEVIRKQIRDDQWNPTVPRSKSLPYGGKGRQIAVRWDLNVGPSDADTVVLLPASHRLPPYVRLATICELNPKSFDSILKAMKDESNWVGLLKRFISEKSLSDFIAAYPHRLEDGLMPYPNAKVQEKVFPDGTRSDVLLVDKNEIPVVVECKQGEPTLKNLKQLRGYIKNVKKETGRKPRGILVHGGAVSLRNEVRQQVARDSQLKIIRYSLNVSFDPCA
jgi:hypothetical protein